MPLLKRASRIDQRAFDAVAAARLPGPAQVAEPAGGAMSASPGDGH